MLETDNSDNPTTEAETFAVEAVDQVAEQGGKPAKAPRKRTAKKAAPAVTSGDAPGATAGTEAADEAPAARKRPAKKAAKKTAEPAAEPAAQPAAPAATEAPVEVEAAAPARKRAPRKKTAEAPSAATTPDAATPAAVEPAGTAAEEGAKPAKAARKRAGKKAAAAALPPVPADAGTGVGDDLGEGAEEAAIAAALAGAPEAPAMAAPVVLFQAPSEVAPVRRRRAAKAPAGPPPSAEAAEEETLEPAPGDVELTVAEDAEDLVAEPEDVREAAVEEATGARRRRRRGRRGRGGAGRAADEGEELEGEAAEEAEDVEAAEGEAAEGEAGEEGEEGAEGTTGTRRRRRRRRAGGGAGGEATDEDGVATVVHVRQPREKAAAEDDGVKGVKGSTRLEAKRQRRRDGRDTGRRRPPILTEAEFLARREAVDRVMAVRQSGDRTQIAVLEDDILVEHYVTRASATSYVGNVYLGRVQNVLPSMEAAFVDIGKGRNGVLYAGEVNWDAAGLEGKSRAIEQALKSGDTVLVQVTKDPIGHKGARLTSQVSLPGRFLVYVPGGGMTGISRKLPDTERHRLKAILKKIVPEDAGVIIRTAAEGASEEDLTRDVERLKAQWETISAKAANTKNAPALVHGEPDLAIRVVRDVFNEDFKKLLVQGDGAWSTVSDYIEGVAPDLAERVSRHTAETDLFHDLRVDEQLAKALDRKVWLPSGGSLVIDRTEAMTVIDVNTGKFVGSGGNLEQTVTRNNLEAAEEIVRQLRLRDVGGIVVIDFIDMVLESNRDLVLRRLTECLGRDRTKHQVAEVTSLGLVQMTRKRVGEGLLEAFSETCDHCKGRGVILHSEPVDRGPSAPETVEEERPRAARRKRGGAKKEEPAVVDPAVEEERRRNALAAIAAIHKAAHHDEEDGVASGEPLAAEVAEALDAAAAAGAAEGLDHDAAAELEIEAVAAVLDAAPIQAEEFEPALLAATTVDGASAGLPDGRRAGGEPIDVELPAAVEPVLDGAAAVEVEEPATDATTELEQPSAEPAEAAEPSEAAEPAETAEPAEAAEVAETEPAGTGAAPARRRRRAASRPAGPPVTATN